MTVAELEARMTISEELEWREYHSILREEHEAAMERAKTGGAAAGSPASMGAKQKGPPLKPIPRRRKQR